MTAFDEIWGQLVAESGPAGNAPDRRLIYDFIALKNANDEIRNQAVERLIALFTELAAHANRRNIAIAIERDEQHNFKAFGSNMVGVKVSFRHGVRCLTIEAGWTRRAGDGIMRGGALAVAHLRHFGIRRHGSDLVLLKSESGHQWFEVDASNTVHPIRPERLARHLAVLIDDHTQ